MMPYSVVIPAWNAERTIAETLQSVLNQTTPANEVIVVDDGSTDTTAEIASGFGLPVRVLAQDNQGPGAATNLGLSNITCDVFACVDADDLWLPTKMETQLTYLQEHPETAIVGCRMRQFHHGQKDDGTGEERGGLNRSVFVARREMISQTGPLIDPIGGRGDFVDWIARARELGFRSFVLPEVLALRRIIPGSLSYGRDPSRDIGYLQIAHAAMLRKRGSDG